MKKLTHDDLIIVEKIQSVTQKYNLNNITRTNAYLDFYMQYPEIHWAFLGHAVSRNGGWNMTDLKGDLISRLLGENKQKEFFDFLERGNWLIFQDVYPQFLLYAECVKRQKNLFYLLPSLGTSMFMEVLWNDFWETRNSYTLAMAQVINEQNYLETRVIQNKKYKEEVLDTLEFLLQDLLSINHLLFPLCKKATVTPLIGTTIHQFSSLHQRITLGRKLYQLLFRDPQRHRELLAWCLEHPHTGSRKDYWPHLFNDVNEGVPGPLQFRRLQECRLTSGTPKFYSPRLEYAWPNVRHHPPEPGDWFHDPSVVRYLKENDGPVDEDISGEYCETLQNLELAVLAKKTVFL
ncbi:DUF2515 family protein [Siminovitchia sediminis]|uniref:DUF2515 family protein n=1 Tax=Siminovitchia sediminis TaxID=1274353 RepID=A0ABW4KF83_9BACI